MNQNIIAFDTTPGYANIGIIHKTGKPWISRLQYNSDHTISRPFVYDILGSYMGEPMVVLYQEYRTRDGRLQAQAQKERLIHVLEDYEIELTMIKRHEWMSEMLPMISKMIGTQTSRINKLTVDIALRLFPTIRNDILTSGIAGSLLMARWYQLQKNRTDIQEKLGD